MSEGKDKLTVHQILNNSRYDLPEKFSNFELEKACYNWKASNVNACIYKSDALKVKYLFEDIFKEWRGKKAPQTVLEDMIKKVIRRVEKINAAYNKE